MKKNYNFVFWRKREANVKKFRKMCSHISMVWPMSIIFFFIFLSGTSFGISSGKLVFSHDPDIYVMDIDDAGNSSNLVNLTTELSGGKYDPRWSPNGQKIAFRVHINSSEAQIWVMNADGTQKQRLTNTAGYYDQRPAWSPDGSKIAFMRSYGTGTCSAYRTMHVSIINSDGSGLFEIPNIGGHGEYSPEWSPDGTMILYNRDEGTCSNPYDLYTMHSDGTGKRLLYPSAGQDMDWMYQAWPRWGINGKIAFSEMTGTWDHWEIGVINADGSGHYLIPHPGTGAVRLNCWAFNDTKIIYEATTGSGNSNELWMVNADGTGRIRIQNTLVGADWADFKIAPAPPTPFVLTVTRAGTGIGTVASAPSGISCGSTCSGAFNPGTQVTLTATPGIGSTFGSWQGCDSSSGNQCTVTMNAVKTVTATFNQQVTLTVTKTGLGSGTVSSNPTNIDCGTTCSNAFNSGTQVTLTATPDPGSVFGSWQGCDSSSGNQCLVTMNGAKTVTAAFDLCSHSITPTNILVSASGGTGTITVTASSRDCTGSWTAVSNDPWITITGSTGTGSSTVGYSVPANQTSYERTGTITVAGQTFTVVQLQPNRNTLSVTVVGQGTVTSDPAGVDCGSDCSEPYIHGSAVTLTATPAEGYSFDGWSGGECTGTAPCAVTLNGDTAITASFSTPSIVKLAPQVLMAGFDPILLDLTTTRVRIMALVREGNQPIAGVSITDNIGSLSFAMNLMGRLSNGDLLYGAELSLDRGPDFSLPNLFGSGSGKILIKAVDTLGLSHSFPTVFYGNNPDMTSPQSRTDSPLYTQQGCKRLLPQVLMAGLEPALLDFDDSQLKVRAIVREGARPIQDVSLKTNNGLLNLSMDLVESLANGDRLYEKTIIFARGSFGQIESNFENLWGGMNSQFMIEVRDDGGQTHSFPDLKRGDFRAINPTECWSDQ